MLKFIANSLINHILFVYETQRHHSFALIFLECKISWRIQMFMVNTPMCKHFITCKIFLPTRLSKLLLVWIQPWCRCSYSFRGKIVIMNIKGVIHWWLHFCCKTCFLLYRLIRFLAKYTTNKIRFLGNIRILMKMMEESCYALLQPMTTKPL